jgi:hypothetical protein
MIAYVYVYVYVHVSVYVCVHFCIYMHADVNVHVHSCVSAHVHANVHVYGSVCDPLTRPLSMSRVNVNAHVYVYVYACICTRIYLYIYIYIYVLRCSLLGRVGFALGTLRSLGTQLIASLPEYTLAGWPSGRCCSLVLPWVGQVRLTYQLPGASFWVRQRGFRKYTLLFRISQMDTSTKSLEPKRITFLNDMGMPFPPLVRWGCHHLFLRWVWNATSNLVRGTVPI